MVYELPKYKVFHGKVFERQGLALHKASARKMAKELKLPRFRVISFHGVFGLYGGRQ